MRRIKMAIIAASILVATTLPAFSQDQKDATEIMNKVRDTYKDLQSYHFEATALMETKSERAQSKLETTFVIAGVKPDRIRMEVTGSMMGMDILIISNASTIWEYMPRQKKYTKTGATSTTVTRQGVSTKPFTVDKDTYVRTFALALGVNIPSYDKITETLMRPRLVREESVEVDGTSINCYVVEADTTATEFVDRATTSPRTLWIDKSRFVVLRESYTMKLKDGPLGGPTEIRRATDFKVARVNEFVSDTLFVFIPPEGATQVEDLDGSRNEDGARARRKKPLN